MERDAGILGPHGHDFSELAEVLLRYRAEKIVFVPNPGNVGDALIDFGGYLLFERLGIDYEYGRKNQTYPGRVVVYAGGGALIDRYPNADEFLRNNHETCKALILLPHTVRAYGAVLERMDERCTLFAREEPSFDYMRQHCTGGAKVGICHDLAFFVTREDLDNQSWDLDRIRRNGLAGSWIRMVVKFLVLSKIRSRHLNIIRQDVEQTGVAVPDFNHDMATYFSPEDLSRPACGNALKVLAMVMGFFEHVTSNRLHMSVMGAILGLPVTMHDNNYGKNSAIYRHSIAGYFTNVEFVPYQGMA